VTWAAGAQKDDKNMGDELLVGASEVDITPPLGTGLCGGFSARPAERVHDPLYVKAVVIKSGGRKLACATFDLALLERSVGDRCTAAASERTQIPREQIIWAATHTHSGPNTCDLFPGGIEPDTNLDWLAGLPGKFAQCVAAADASLVPARAARLRGYQTGLSANRRLRFKDGRELNTWLLDRGEDQVQCVGTAGPIDPEIGVLAFEDRRGELLAVLFSFALHANTFSGGRSANTISADFPAVVAGRLRERFGPHVSTLFLPGAAGDLNVRPGLTCRQVGDALADEIIRRLERRSVVDRPPAVGACRREIVLPCRDFSADQERRLRQSQWPDPVVEAFRRNLEHIRASGRREIRTFLHAWNLGDTAFACVPGELFVEWGLRLKLDSAFPWTFPVELAGDYVGYLVTRGAWQAGGYEGLISSCAPVDVAGVEAMIAEMLAMLAELRAQAGP